MSRKMTYFGHIKRHSGLEKTVIEGMVPGIQGRRRPRQWWQQDVTETKNMR
uniref:Uncharacterized protein n=1 Tax=Arion vulgaris TaxID=1028688 RepID=A0A0B7AT86_9EUPU